MLGMCLFMQYDFMCKLNYNGYICMALLKVFGKLRTSTCIGFDGLTLLPIKIANAIHTFSSILIFRAFGLQICPVGEGKNQNIWQKHV